MNDNLEKLKVHHLCSFPVFLVVVHGGLFAQLGDNYLKNREFKRTRFVILAR